MLGLLTDETLVLYRRTGPRTVEPWLTVTGDEDCHALALATVLELDAEAANVGGLDAVLAVGSGGLEALGFGVNAQEPRQTLQVVPVVLLEDPADGLLGQLQGTRGLNGPGPVRVRVTRALDDRRVAAHNCARWNAEGGRDPLGGVEGDGRGRVVPQT